MKNQTSNAQNDSRFDNVSTGLALKNFSKSDDEFDDISVGRFHPGVDVPAIALATLIIITNGLALILVARKNYLRSITNLLLCSLALSDLLTGLVSVPLFVTCNIIRGLAVCLTEEQLSRFISASIVSHLMSVVVDRYLAIAHPLRYTSLVTLYRCIMVIICIWTVSAATALVQLTWLNPLNHDPHDDLSESFKRAELIYDILFLILFFLIPLLFMCFTYARITFEIIRQSRNIQRDSMPGLQNTRRRSRNRHEWRAIAIFAAMMFVYIICWLPYFMLRRFDLSELPVTYILAVVWLRYFASLLNPCMYIFGKKDFRRALLEYVRPIKPQRNSSPSKSTALKTTANAKDLYSKRGGGYLEIGRRETTTVI